MARALLGGKARLLLALLLAGCTTPPSDDDDSTPATNPDDDDSAAPDDDDSGEDPTPPDEPFLVEVSPLVAAECGAPNGPFSEAAPLDIQPTTLAEDFGPGGGDRFQDELGAGVAAADFTGDGIVDLVFTAHQECNAFFRGDGDGTFTRVEDTGAELCEGEPHYSLGAHPVDLDMDGDWDVVVTGHVGLSEHVLLLNEGDGTFTSAPLGVASGRTLSVVPADFDRDGAVDLFLSNFFDRGMEQPSTGCSQLLMGRGDGTFGDSSDLLPARVCDAAGFDGAVVVNPESGELDLMAVFDKGFSLETNMYLRGLGLQGDRPNFEDASDELAFGVPSNTMGVLPWYWEDSLWVFWTTGDKRNILLRRDEGGFVEVSSADQGLNGRVGPHMTWDGEWFPGPDGPCVVYDQGEFPDQWAGPADLSELPPYTQCWDPALGRFVDRPDDGSSWWHGVNATGSTMADFDGDGRPDLIKHVLNPEREYGAFLNTLCVEDSVVVDVMDGPVPAYGARLELKDGETTLATGFVGAGHGLFGGGQPDVFLRGTGTLHILWPGGERSEHAVEAGSRVEITRKP